MVRFSATPDNGEVATPAHRVTWNATIIILVTSSKHIDAEDVYVLCVSQNLWLIGPKAWHNMTCQAGFGI